MANGFTNSRNGTGVVFQGARHKHITFDVGSYSRSTSTDDDLGYFALTDKDGVEYPFQVVMEVGGRMMVQGWKEKGEEPQMMYFASGENSFLCRRIYYVADNDATEFWIEY